MEPFQPHQDQLGKPRRRLRSPKEVQLVHPRPSQKERGEEPPLKQASCNVGHIEDIWVSRAVLFGTGRPQQCSEPFSTVPILRRVPETASKTSDSLVSWRLL